MTTKNPSKQYMPAHIANFFLWKADEEDINNITLLKLIKLVYFAYGWYLAVYDKKLFNEKIEAWRYGPVIPSIYHEFKEFGNSPVCRYAVEFIPETGEFDYPIIDKKDEQTIQLLEAVWNVYKNRSAVDLSRITHDFDSPWSHAYSQGKNQEIKDSDIKKRAKDAILKYKDLTNS
jgi:uncharacterized phage-associated protein